VPATDRTAAVAPVRSSRPNTVACRKMPWVKSVTMSQALPIVSSTGGAQSRQEA
jgi:hypothetical protein